MIAKRHVCIEVLEIPGAVYRAFEHEPDGGPSVFYPEVVCMFLSQEEGLLDYVGYAEKVPCGVVGGIVNAEEGYGIQEKVVLV